MNEHLNPDRDGIAGDFELMHQPQTFVDTVGPIWRRAGPGLAELQLTVEAHHTNPNGTVHGGLLMTLMDLALGSAVEGALDTGGPEGHGHPITMQMSCSMIAGAGLGERLDVEACVDRVTRTVGFVSGRIHAGGRLVMTGTGVFKTPSSGAGTGRAPQR